LTPTPEIYILYQAREKGTVTVKCPQCDFKNPDDTFYCGKCGASLKPSKEVSITKTLQTPLPSPDKTIAGKYIILSELGRGGMGVVYKAKDTRLKRMVALKFLPVELTHDPESKERFIHEAQAAASLSHPNICTIHETDEAEGKSFITMEYIEGQSVKEKVKQGRLVQEEALEISLRVAEGLKAAHEKGVIHRDVKSANIMVTEKGQAKIMDFGLAKMIGGTLITKEATTMGTVAYMSPEQARGQAVDKRTDIWSLGIVLYEMLTGQLPFKGEHEQSMIFSILNDEPKLTRDLGAEISPELEQVIATALKKNPDERYQHIGEMLDDLRSIAQGIAPLKVRTRLRRTKLTRKKRTLLFAGSVILTVILAVIVLSVLIGRAEALDSIAVLPLDNLSGDPDQEYFSDGITDALINELAQISALRVISRQSVMQYKGSTKPMPEIAKELNVKAVVEASVLTAGSRVRINAKLVQASTDQTLWAQSYEREMIDILVLQSEVVQTLAQEIKVGLTPEEKARLTSSHIVDAEAHKAYLKGRYFLNKLTPEDINKAIEYFQQAIEMDPDYAPPYAGLSDACFHLVDWVIPPEDTSAIEDARTKSREAARRAIEIDETLSEAHSSMATARLFYDWDWAGAEASFKRAIELNPGDALAHIHYSQFLSLVGKHKTALEEAKRAEELVPLSPLAYYYVGQAYFLERQYDQANQQLEKALEFNPNFIPALNLYGYVYYEKNRRKDALAMWGKMHDLTGRKELAKAFVELDFKEALHKWLELSDTPGSAFCLKPSTYALVYMFLEEKDEAFKWFERAYNERDTSMVFIKMDPVYDFLRSDPRFQDLISRMDFPE
jgi:serine/threonine protein kinase/Tfp pilus assembly protein PilF